MRRDVGIGEALIDVLFLAGISRAREERIVVRQVVRPFKLRDTHERLDGAVGGQAATEEEEAIAGEQSLQQLRSGKSKWMFPSLP